VTDDHSAGGERPPSRGDARPPSARRFVALPLPDGIRRSLAAQLPDDPELRDGRRWTRPDGWHVTLAFLGSVPDGSVPDVEAALTQVLGGPDANWPAQLRLAGFGTFGHRVLWVAVADDPRGALGALACGVRGALADAGHTVDDKPLRPHVTLARAGRRQITATLVAACGDPPRASWQPETVELWRSELGRGPAHYAAEVVISR